MSEEKKKDEPFGRPPKYNVSFCQRYVDLRAKGLSIYEVAHKMDLCRDTMWRWRREHYDFSVAFKKGDNAYKAFLIERCSDNLENKKLNQALMIFMMKLGGLREHSDELEIPANFNFSGTFKEKVRQVDDMLATQEISTESAQRLMNIISQQSEVLERAVTNEQVRKDLDFLKERALST